MRIRHPAWEMPFDDLVAGMRHYVATGDIKETPGPDGLTLFNYTKQCAAKKVWNPYTRVARGIVLALEERRIIATPLPKFFSRKEGVDPLPDLPFEPFEKLDGTFGTTFNHRNRIRATSRGSFTSPQAQWAQRWMDERIDAHRLPPGPTIFNEIIYAEDRHFVHHDFEACVLLGAYDHEGYELETAELEMMAARLNMPMAKRFDYKTIDEVIKQNKALNGRRQEGFVVRYSNGQREKYKCDDYLRQQREVSRLTPLVLWESILACENLDAKRLKFSEDFLIDFDTIRELLQQKFDQIIVLVERCHADCVNQSDRELAATIKSLPAQVGPFVFDRRRHGPQWFKEPRSHERIMRHIRPVGNRLEGYTPSSLTLRCQQEDE